MNATDLLRLLGRRWLPLLAFMVMGVALTLPLTQTTPLYWTQTDVLFVSPGNSLVDSVDETITPDLVVFAGALSRRINDGRPTSRLASASAPIYGAGLREGYSVEVPNVGGQWENSFTRPVVSVQVVGSSPDEVQHVLTTVIGTIETASADLQDQFGVTAANRINAQPVTPDANIAYVGRTRSGGMRGVAALAVVIVAGSVALTVEVDRRLARRVARTPEATGAVAA